MARITFFATVRADGALFALASPRQEFDFLPRQGELVEVSIPASGQASRVRLDLRVREVRYLSPSWVMLMMEDLDMSFALLERLEEANWYAEPWDTDPSQLLGDSR